jgi:hypothetical protein
MVRAIRSVCVYRIVGFVTAPKVLLTLPVLKFPDAPGRSEPPASPVITGVFVMRPSTYNDVIVIELSTVRYPIDGAMMDPGRPGTATGRNPAMCVAMVPNAADAPPTPMV